jgi:hypothetical protein
MEGFRHHPHSAIEFAAYLRYDQFVTSGDSGLDAGDLLPAVAVNSKAHRTSGRAGNRDRDGRTGHRGVQRDSGIRCNPRRPESGVGVYNTSLDLCADLAGAVLDWCMSGKGIGTSQKRPQ